MVTVIAERMERGYPPRWFAVARRAVFTGYAAVVIGCLAGALALPLLGGVGYGDWSSYRLYGNPWDSSRLPWYIVYSFRLVSTALILLVSGVIFTPLYIGAQLLLARLVASRTANTIALIRMGSAMIAIALVVMLYGTYLAHSR